MFIEPQQSGDKKIIQAQFNEKPYPDFSVSESFNSNNFNELFKHSFAVPYFKLFRGVYRSEGVRILDVGCGSGHKLLYLAKANPGSLITAVDFSADSLDVACQRMKFHGIDNIDFHCVSLDDIPLLGKSFDFINCDEVLYLSEDIVASLCVLKSVLSPRGIIRANLHNYYNRFYSNCSQEAFEMLGLKDEPPGEFRRDFVRIFMSSLVDSSVFKKILFPTNTEVSDSSIEMNCIFFGDKGFTFPQLFSSLRDSGLSFIDLVNVSDWSLNVSFPDSSSPEIFSDVLQELSFENKLHLCELVNPKRLMDFWCCIEDNVSSLSKDPLSADSLVILNSLLNTNLVKQDLINSCHNFLPFEATKYISLSSAFPIFLDSAQASIILPLFDGPVKCVDLVNAFMCQPYLDSSGNRFSSMSFEKSFAFVSELIHSLESCSFVFVL